MYSPPPLPRPLPVRSGTGAPMTAPAPAPAPQQGPQPQQYQQPQLSVVDYERGKKASLAEIMARNAAMMNDPNNRPKGYYDDQEG
jgi:hypothetical protein